MIAPLRGVTALAIPGSMLPDCWSRGGGKTVFVSPHRGTDGVDEVCARVCVAPGRFLHGHHCAEHSCQLHAKGSAKGVCCPRYVHGAVQHRHAPLHESAMIWSKTVRCIREDRTCEKGVQIHGFRRPFNADLGCACHRTLITLPPPLNAPSMPPPVHLRYSTPPASPAPPAHPSRPPTSPTPPTPKYTQASAPHSRQKSQVKKTRSFHTSPPYRILLSPVEGRITLKLPTLPYPAAFIAPPAPLAPRYSSPHQWRPSSTQTTTADSRRAT
jgi:hypothetical protein